MIHQIVWIQGQKKQFWCITCQNWVLCKTHLWRPLLPFCTWFTTYGGVYDTYYRPKALYTLNSFIFFNMKFKYLNFTFGCISYPTLTFWFIHSNRLDVGIDQAWCDLWYENNKNCDNCMKNFTKSQSESNFYELNYTII